VKLTRRRAAVPAAGIGAAGGVALSVLSAGLALLISERRERQRKPKEG
jgi:hypothetical protein